jgi:hypothetical protein
VRAQSLQKSNGFRTDSLDKAHKHKSD